MKNQKFKGFLIELSEEEYKKLERLVESGKYRTKISIIRDLLKNIDAA
jgi:Arc/MetJ-type ribon-helix-helix transcriptional regulator